jgi:circularin A/uberolysin family circular bacteriocin
MLLEIANLLHISSHWASKVIDLVLAGASAWAIVSAIVAGGGIVAIGVVVLRQIVLKKIKQVGYAAAVAY